MSSRFLESFSRSCALFPESPAIVHRGTSVSYRDLAGLVQGIRSHLDANLPVDDCRIGIWASQEILTYASIIAVLMTGRAYVPLNPKAPAERNRSCVEQAEVRTLLCASVPEVAAAVSGMSTPLQVVNVSEIRRAEGLGAIEAIDDNSMAYLLFTSGSTGTPKGVPIYHRNLNHFLDAFLTRGDVAFESNDRFLQMFDLTFDLSVVSYAAPLCIGAAVHLVPDDGPGFLRIAGVLERDQVTVALMVPSVLGFLERYFADLRLPALRVSLFCGEALPERLARGWQQCIPAARLFNVYGPTEATIFCSSFELTRAVRDGDTYQGVVSIGHPMSGTRFRVVDDNLEAVVPGEKGELIIIGAQVTDSYWRNPGKTHDAFITLPDGTEGYRSGDLVFESHSEFYYCGRRDNQLKVDGYRVEGGEIEFHARQFEQVRDAALVGRTTDSGSTVLHLFLLSDLSLDESWLRDCKRTLAQRLPSYMVPHKIHVLSTFPLNQNGKVDRRTLLARVQEG